MDPRSCALMLRVPEVLAAADQVTTPSANTPTESQWIYLDTDYGRQPTNLINRKTRKPIDQSIELKILTWVEIEFCERTELAAGMTRAEIMAQTMKEMAELDRGTHGDEKKLEVWAMMVRGTVAFTKKMVAAMEEWEAGRPGEA
jgi:hypothetical protein